MRSTSRWRYATAFIAVVVASVGLGACGGDTPSGPGPLSGPGPTSGPAPQPAFDFSGDLIAFETQRDGNREIYVMTPDGANAINITNNAAADGDAAWSPDGSRIAFASTRDGNTEMYVMNVDGTGVTRLTNQTAVDRHPNW